jgi:hypothetical protein
MGWAVLIGLGVVDPGIKVSFSWHQKRIYFRLTNLGFFLKTRKASDQLFERWDKKILHQQ